MTFESESDRDKRRADTREKLVTMIRKLRADTLACKITGDHGYNIIDVTDALNAVFRDSEILDEEIACFLSVCVGEWIRRGHGGDPRLETMVVVKP